MGYLLTLHAGKVKGGDKREGKRKNWEVGGRHAGHVSMQCMERSVCFLSWGFIIGGVLFLLHQLKVHTQYGRYVDTSAPGVMVPAKAAWFIQELPSVLVPVFLLLSTDTSHSLGRSLLVCTFCLHYFQR